MKREALERLSKDDLIALALALAAQVEALTRRVAEFEAKLGQPPKTPENSSLPPSKGERANRPDRPKKPRPGRPGTFRALAENPDRIVEAFATVCPHCDHDLTPADQPDAHAYDHIDLPPIRPIILRVHRHRGVCPCCGKSFAASAPEGLDPGSPFGATLVALIVHLHVTQAISFARLVVLLDEVFGVDISEGAIANLLARAQAPLVAAAEAIGQEVRASPVIGSDGPLGNAEGGKPPPGSSARLGGSGFCCPRPPSITSSPTAAPPRP